MVLSIGMIVRDGEQYLEQCLTALQPIFKELDSELIIADTGSTDRTVEIAKKFTDNVFHFEWINDFSAARNFTLQKSKGEWFMYIDQDEVAVDCTGLINFFKSGEYKKYKSGAYVQRNLKYLDDPTQYSDFRQIVAVKREPGTKFINEFHEELVPIRSPLKYLDFIVMHYGFAFAGEDGKERARAKSERNLKGLMDELEHTKGEPRANIYSQIADCYKIIDDFETALKYLDIGMEKMDRNKSGTSIMYYFKKISGLSKLKRYDELIMTADEYFDVKINPFHTKEYATDAQIRWFKGMAYARTCRYREGIGEFLSFFDLYKRYFDGKLLTSELVSTPWLLFDNELKNCYIAFFTCCLEEKEYELADKYAREMPLDKFLDDEGFMRDLLTLRLMIMKRVGYNGFGELYSRLDDRSKEFLRQVIFPIDPQNRGMIMKKLSALGGSAKELAEIYRALYSGEAYEEKVLAFLKAHGSKNAVDLLYIMMKNQMDITPFVLAEDFQANRTAQAMFRVFPNSINILVAYHIENVSPDGLCDAIALYLGLLSCMMNPRRPVTALFEKYGALGLRWNIVFKGAETPDDVFAALAAGLAVIAKRNKDRNAFIKALGQLKTLVPDLASVADAYEQENKDVFPAPAPKNKFDQLAAEVKQNIRSMIDTGNLTDAETLLAEFRALCPNDPDIAVMAKEISGT